MKQTEKLNQFTVQFSIDTRVFVGNWSWHTTTTVQLQPQSYQSSHSDILLFSLVFLDPPSNLSVQPLESARQVNLSWLPPPVAHMGNNLRYEVAIFPEGYKTRQVSH